MDSCTVGTAVRPEVQILSPRLTFLNNSPSRPEPIDFGTVGDVRACHFDNFVAGGQLRAKAVTAHPLAAIEIN